MITRKNLQISLKTKYPMVLKQSLVITLLIFITAFYFNQKIVHRAAPISTNITKVSDILTPIATKIDMPQVKRPATPVIPIEATDDEGLIDVDGLISSLQSPHIFDPTDVPVFEKGEFPERDIPFYALDQKPEPVGGLAALQRNVIYPEIAQEVGVEGTVFVKAHINSSGDVTECIILRGYDGTGLNEAAIEAIKKTKFTPAMQRDRKVSVWMSIPIVFKLR